MVLDTISPMTDSRTISRRSLAASTVAVQACSDASTNFFTIVNCWRVGRDTSMSLMALAASVLMVAFTSIARFLLEHSYGPDGKRASDPA